MASVLGETSLIERVSAVAAGLATAYSYDHAYMVLSGADLATLRALDEEYHFSPTPAGALRERIARSHAKIMAQRTLQAADTSQVGPAYVRHLAEISLSDWFCGVTDFEPEVGGQYIVRRVIGPSTQDGIEFEIATINGFDPRRFRVKVDVKEIDRKAA